MNIRYSNKRLSIVTQFKKALSSNKNNTYKYEDIPTRTQMIQHLKNNPNHEYDLIVIGCGATGSGIDFITTMFRNDLSILIYIIL